MASELWLEVVLILLLIVANGFFSGSEIAVVSVRRSRIEQLAEQGSTSARLVGRLKEDADRFLATVQIGVTLVGSLASAVGGASAIEYIGPLLQQSSIPFLQERRSNISSGKGRKRASSTILSKSSSTVCLPSLIPPCEKC